MRKKGLEAISENLIFIILNTIFFVALFVFVARASTGAAYYEQIYAKQIALLIDSAKPGMNITIKLSPLVDIAKKNKLNLGLEDIVDTRQKQKQKVTVKVSKKQYTFVYFNSLKFNAYYNEQAETVKFEFVKET
jgi:predicted RNA-binding protein with RPS1 domain